MFLFRLSVEDTKVRYFKVNENILISVLAFLLSGGKSCKKKKNHHGML